MGLKSAIFTNVNHPLIAGFNRLAQEGCHDPNSFMMVVNGTFLYWFPSNQNELKIIAGIAQKISLGESSRQS